MAFKPGKPASEESSSEAVATISELERYKQMSLLDIEALGYVEASDPEEGLGGEQWGAIVSDKSMLCGVPFLIVAVKMNVGDNGDFVTLLVLTKSGDRYIVNDGSTGIRDQLTQR